MSALQHTIETEPTPDPAKVPDGAKETSTGVTIPDDQTPPADPPKTDDERPSWLPEKFKSPEDMAAAYAELERKQSAPAEDPPKTEDQPTAEQAVEQAGIDPDALQAELAANDGVPSEETYAKFEKVGITRAMVDGYIEGQKAIADTQRGKMAEAVGGAEALSEMLAWAKDGLSKAEVGAFNAAVQSGDEGSYMMALRSLKAAYTDANGNPPKLIRDGSTPDTGVKPYASSWDMTRDMGDPRYKQDPAFRANVQARIAAGM